MPRGEAGVDVAGHIQNILIGIACHQPHVRDDPPDAIKLKAIALLARCIRKREAIGRGCIGDLRDDVVRGVPKEGQVSLRIDEGRTVVEGELCRIQGRRFQAWIAEPEEQAVGAKFKEVRGTERTPVEQLRREVLTGVPDEPGARIHRGSEIAVLIDTNAGRKRPVAGEGPFVLAVGEEHPARIARERA